LDEVAEAMQDASHERFTSKPGSPEHAGSIADEIAVDHELNDVMTDVSSLRPDAPQIIEANRDYRRRTPNGARDRPADGEPPPDTGG